SCQLRVLSPLLLELTLITTKQPDPSRVTQWDFIDGGGGLRLPSKEEFAVTAGGKTIAIERIGFKRRVIYAPFKKRDLRIGNYLYVQLAIPVAEGQLVEVKNPDKKLWPATMEFSIKTDPLRWSPVIHINQTGYLPNYPKKA